MAADASKTLALPAAAAMAFVDGFGWRSGNSPYRGCTGSKARGSAGRYSSYMPPTVIEATLAPPESTPPPEDIPIPELSPPPDIKPEFVEEKNAATAAAAERAKVRAGLRLPRCRCPEQKHLRLDSPRPPYPYEARSKRITGSGGWIVASVDAGIWQR